MLWALRVEVRNQAAWQGFSQSARSAPEPNWGLRGQVMWNTAVHAEFVHDHADYGFETAGVKFNWR